MTTPPFVGIIMGSQSDWATMREAAELLTELDVPFDAQIVSAHRTPDRLWDYGKTAVERGLQVIIAGAGMAAHLAGVLAAHTDLPVIGVPLDASPLGGMDSLLSTVQMPPGIPVATMGIGKAGAKNAGVFALKMLALNDPALAQKVVKFRQDMVLEVEAKAKNVRI
jgi:phosphoribosylamine--glycine ligase